MEVIYALLAGFGLFFLIMSFFVEVSNKEGKDSFKFVLILGLMILGAVAVWGPFLFRNGSPAMVSLPQGTHKVGFVYVAGPTVSLGIEEKTLDQEHLRFYQLPLDYFIFGGREVNTKAKVLKIFSTQDGKIVRYFLE